MTPPTSVTVGLHTFTVEVGDGRRVSADGVRGATYMEDLRIVVDDDMPPSRQRETLLHEVLHAVLDGSGARSHLDGGAAEEGVVQCAAPMLLATLRANPDLLAFLLDGTS